MFPPDGPNTMAVAPVEERSAASGFTAVARTTGAAISPRFVGFMFARSPWINVPFFLGGALKILYDLVLSKEFVSIPPVEERSQKQMRRKMAHLGRPLDCADMIYASFIWVYR